MTAPAPQEPHSRPRGLPFPLQDGEEVLQIYRRHRLHLYGPLLALGVKAAAPALILALVLSKVGALEGRWNISLILTALWLAFWSVRAFLAWYRFHNDVWVITNQRIIDSIRTSPLSLKLSTADLINVLDMTVERKGLFQTVFDFGDVICQTAAELQEFRLTGIPHPREVQALVDRERDRERLRASAGGLQRG